MFDVGDRRTVCTHRRRAVQDRGPDIVNHAENHIEQAPGHSAGNRDLNGQFSYLARMK